MWSAVCHSMVTLPSCRQVGVTMSELGPSVHNVAVNTAMLLHVRP